LQGDCSSDVYSSDLFRLHRRRAQRAQGRSQPGQIPSTSRHTTRHVREIAVAQPRITTEDRWQREFSVDSWCQGDPPWLASFWRSAECSDVDTSSPFRVDAIAGRSVIWMFAWRGNGLK